MLIQHTSLKKRHQSQPDVQFPKTVHQIIWYWASMRVACQTCQHRCIGKHLYACEASDFQRSFGLNLGFLHMTARIFAPRSDKLSRTTKPPSVGIREFSDFKPTLWSFTSHSLVEPFFGTVNMGCVTIPGSKFGLNASEYCPSEISASRWDFKKINDSSLSTGNPCRCITDP